VAIGDDVYSERLPTYLGGDDFSSDFFWPIHQADRCLRPQVWYEPTR
jgi:hypothetical protein